MIKSHKTMYAGCVYRSRLEATWAAFFDILGWQYQYEPFDLNGWVPDFVLIGKKSQTLVEVKPYFSLDEFVKNGVVDKALRATAKTPAETLLLGCSVFKGSYSSTILGWLNDRHWGDADDTGWDDFEECTFDKSGFCSAVGSYVNRITEDYDGSWQDIEFNEAKELFNNASNKTRWNPDKRNKTILENKSW